MTDVVHGLKQPKLLMYFLQVCSRNRRLSTAIRRGKKYGGKGETDYVFVKEEKMVSSYVDAYS